MKTGNQIHPPIDHVAMASTRRRRPSLARLAVGTGITLAMAVAAVSCGEDDSETVAPPAATAETDAADGAAVGVSAEIGEQLSRSMGCAGCHGQDFDGGAGPGWVGLAGSEVLLTDGTTVIADDEYLTTAIADPSAQLVEGYTLRMPANGLTADEITDVVAFINSLADG